MDELTIIGAGISGLALIEKIRAKDKDCKLRLIDKEQYHFPNYRKISQPADITSKIDISIWSKEVNVEFIKAKVDKINPGRKKIYFKQAEPINFSRLIVATGLSSRKLPIKGGHREGFFYLSQINPFVLKDLLRVSQEAIVYVSTFLGLRLTLSLRSLGKEVKIIAPNFDFLGSYQGKVCEFLEEKDIPFYLNSSVEEAVGEARIKAVKISPLKLYSAQLLFVDSGFESNRNFFDEEIAGHDVFFTNFKDVYLLGDVNEKDIDKEAFFAYNHDNSQEQAKVFADYLLEGKDPVFQKRLFDLDDKSRLLSGMLQEKETTAR